MLICHHSVSSKCSYFFIKFMDIIAENYLTSSDEDPYAGEDSDNDPTYYPDENHVQHNYFFAENGSKASLQKKIHKDVVQSTSQKENINPDRRLTRKRKRQPEKWVRNINRKLCEHGKEYRNVKGEIKRKRDIITKKDCSTNCKFRCSIMITDTDRQKIHEAFWALSDDCKLHFYNQTTERTYKKRNTVKGATESRRTYSYKYYFYTREEQIRVCKQFFLGTLDISQRRITYFYENKREELTATPKQSIQGKHPKKVISLEQKQIVRNHIMSMPRIESHYCRMRTNKEYLESTLNLSKLYDLYKEMCATKDYEIVKPSYYRYIFNYEFNIEFMKPKADRCDMCEEMRIARHSEQQTTEENKIKYQNHSESMEATKNNRDKDRNNTDKETAIICFDLENVFPLPRSNISCFFYSKKLNTYNLTVHLNINKRGYCAIWSEGLHGRKAIDIASALIKILTKILDDHQNITKMILWSDSCVPQNKNAVMTLALKKFMEQHPQIKQIVQKFSEPGHSCVQEVDNIHSQIEKSIAGQEIFSPLGLLRALLRVNRRKPFNVFHMQISDFKEYQKATQTLNFKVVPFASVKQIKYILDEPWKVYFKLKHSDDTIPFTSADIRSIPTRRQRLKAPEFCKNSNQVLLLPSIKDCTETKTCLLPEDKVFHLYKLFKFMPEVDVTFMKTLFHEYKQQSKLTKLRKKFKNPNISTNLHQDEDELRTQTSAGPSRRKHKVKPS